LARLTGDWEPCGGRAKYNRRSAAKCRDREEVRTGENRTRAQAGGGKLVCCRVSNSMGRGGFMRLVRTVLAVAICSMANGKPAQEARPKTAGHYLFAWAGDVEHKGNDFLAVIDADPASPSYGQLVTSVGTDQKTARIHHTEYTMPASGMLFANDHDAGRTF